MKWLPWKRTISETIPEFEAWDETDQWYMTIERTGVFAKKTGLLSLLGWSWHVVHILPDEDKPRYEKNGWAWTQKGAQRAAERMAAELESFVAIFS